MTEKLYSYSDGKIRYRRIKSEEPIVMMYFSSSEIAEALHEMKYNINYWAEVFEVSRKKIGRHWSYPRSSVAIFHHIKRLLREDKYTIEGAKEKLKLIPK